ncbi:hypothetical protein U3A58_01680 [Algoriphagus sp. C2-6-M1]|uniref:hypothetical protein n=1 Tax=Algoriphagus persicinus TaxID=3108754 RepID=UPI002B37C978|nr:hypothetical protein [Algoriphagus sp. C2-6-M1]MEB2779086.1 hypothetical protein [Algoriphagus sp. C2-6-M1]
MSNSKIALLQENGYSFIFGGRIKNESEALMKSSMSKNDTQPDDYLPCEIPSRFLRHGTGYDQ